MFYRRLEQLKTVSSHISKSISRSITITPLTKKEDFLLNHLKKDGERFMYSTSLSFRSINRSSFIRKTIEISDRLDIGVVFAPRNRISREEKYEYGQKGDLAESVFPLGRGELIFPSTINN